MRWEVAKRFDQSISPIRSEVKSIALVGGSENDSEIKQFLNTEVSVTFLGVEPVKNFHFRYFDLNQKNVIDEQYDLVICSQVLEHIWDLKVGLENLANLTKPNGHLWINCPFSNHSHGSPEFFSAGYAPAIILKLGSPLKLEKIFACQIGSWRQYFFTHTIQYWPTEDIYLRPWKIPISRYFLPQIFWRILAMGKNSEVTENERSATETIVFLKKNE